MDFLFRLLTLWFSVPGSSSSYRAPVLWYPGLGHYVSSPSSSASLNGFRTESFRKEGEWCVFPFKIFVNLLKFLFCFFIFLAIFISYTLQIFCSAFIFSSISCYIMSISISPESQLACNAIILLRAMALSVISLFE